MSLGNLKHLVHGKTISEINVLRADDVSGIMLSFDDGSFLKLRGKDREEESFIDFVNTIRGFVTSKVIYSVGHAPGVAVNSSIFPGVLIIFSDGTSTEYRFDYWYDVKYGNDCNESHTIRIEQGVVKYPVNSQLSGEKNKCE